MIPASAVQSEYSLDESLRRKWGTPSTGCRLEKMFCSFEHIHLELLSLCHRVSPSEEASDRSGRSAACQCKHYHCKLLLTQRHHYWNGAHTHTKNVNKSCSDSLSRKMQHTSPLSESSWPSELRLLLGFRLLVPGRRT